MALTCNSTEPTMTASVAISGVDTSSKAFGDLVSVTYTIYYSITNSQKDSIGRTGEIFCWLEQYIFTNGEYAWMEDSLVFNDPTSSSGTLTGYMESGFEYPSISDKMRLACTYKPVGASSTKDSLSNEINITH